MSGAWRRWFTSPAPASGEGGAAADSRAGVGPGWLQRLLAIEVLLPIPGNLPGLPRHRALIAKRRLDERLEGILNHERKGQPPSSLVSVLAHARDEAGAPLGLTELGENLRLLILAGYATPWGCLRGRSSRSGWRCTFCAAASACVSATARRARSTIPCPTQAPARRSSLPRWPVPTAGEIVETVGVGYNGGSPFTGVKRACNQTSAAL